MIDSTEVESHPESEQIDLLRAGLLDDATEHKASVLRHLENCRDCRNRSARWQQIAGGESREGDALSRQLRERRRLALDGKGSARTRRQTTARLVLTGIAAAMILAIGTVIGLQVWRPQTPTPNVAQATKVPDLYSDIDFYLWVSHEDTSNGGHENQS